MSVSAIEPDEIGPRAVLTSENVDGAEAILTACGPMARSFTAPSTRSA